MSRISTARISHYEGGADEHPTLTIEDPDQMLGEQNAVQLAASLLGTTADDPGLSEITTEGLQSTTRTWTRPREQQLWVSDPANAYTVRLTQFWDSARQVYRWKLSCGRPNEKAHVVLAIEEILTDALAAAAAHLRNDEHRRSRS